MEAERAWWQRPTRRTVAADGAPIPIKDLNMAVAQQMLGPAAFASNVPDAGPLRGGLDQERPTRSSPERRPPQSSGCPATPRPRSGRRSRTLSRSAGGSSGGVDLHPFQRLRADGYEIYWCTAESNCVVFAFAALRASGRWRFLGPQATALCQASSIAGLGLGSRFGFVSQRSGWCAGPATTRRRRRSRRGRNSRRPGGGGSRESGSLADSAGLP
jgi:hypothetical protein